MQEAGEEFDVPRHLEGSDEEHVDPHKNASPAKEEQEVSTAAATDEPLEETELEDVAQLLKGLDNPGDTCGVGCFDRAVKRTNNGRA